MDDDYPTYATALTFNQTLWTILQADLSGDGDGLPENLRDDLLALGDPRPKHLDSLIEINRNLARGFGFQWMVSGLGAFRTH